MSLDEFLSLNSITHATFKDMILCAKPYVGMLRSGKAHPSYRMAVRIEQATGGAVPRSEWGYYAEGDFRPHKGRPGSFKGHSTAVLTSAPDALSDLFGAVSANVSASVAASNNINSIDARRFGIKGVSV